MLNNPNRLIQALCRDPEGVARLNNEREAVFSEYGLSDIEKEALLSLDTLSMVSKAEVHPILAMHYLIATKPQAAESMSIKEYPALLEGDEWQK